MSIVDVILNISSSMQKMLDLMAFDEELGSDFEAFLKKFDIEITSQVQLTKIMMFYIFDSYTLSGARVLDVIEDKHVIDDEIIKSFKNSYRSIFKVNKVNLSSINVYSLLNEKEYDLMTLSKTSSMKGIGVKDYIEARIIKLNEYYFVLDIENVIPSNSTLYALSVGINYLIKNPKNIYFDNDEKYKEFENIVDTMTKSFLKCTGSPCIITTNKLADGLLEYFNSYHHNLLKEDDSLDKYISDSYENKYFDIDKLKNENSVNDLAFDNMAGGFSAHSANYSVGFWVDNELGIFIIPNLAIFFEIFKVQSVELRNTIEGWRECINEFLTLDKIPVSVIKSAFELNKHSVDIINNAMYTNFKSIDEIIEFYKPQYNDKKRFSPTIVLYNSKIFMDILTELNKIDNSKPVPKNIGRNDPCPCGSGKKYKNCCLNK